VFSNFNWWQLAITFSVITLCIISIIIALKKTKTSVKVEDSKGNKIQVGDNSDPQKPTIEAVTTFEPVPEKEESFIPAQEEIAHLIPYCDQTLLALVIKKSILFGNKQTEISMVLKVQDQMNSAQIKINLFKGHLMKVYQDLIIEKKGNNANLLHDTAYIIFSSVVHNQAEQILLNLKQRFRENHFTDKHEEEFEEYVEGYISFYMDDWYSALSTFYPAALDPSREEIRNTITRNDDNILREFLRDCFFQARTISMRNKTALQLMEAKFDKDIEDIIKAHETNRLNI